ncbi:hypothetical protein HUJ05_006050 [Dendroctonus ponderosae]|nr:hypothetical protein HUJ05_006050 [Dendroctonus ponderosae]
MALKLTLIFLAAIALCQLFCLQGEASIVRREAPATTEKNELEEALNSIRQGLEEFVSKVQARTSEVYQNASKLLDEFGQKVKQQGDQLVQKIKDNTATKN